MSKKCMSRKVVAGLLTAASVFTIGIATAAAEKNQEEGFSIEASYFKPSLTFKIYSPNSIDYNNGAVDFKNDLGITDKNTRDYRIHFGDHFRISYMNIGYSGVGRISQDLEYEGVTYTGNANVDSSLDMKYARVTFIKPFTDFWGTKTNLLLDIKGFDINAKVTGTPEDNLGVPQVGTTQTSEKKVRGVVPTVGVGIDTYFGDNVKLYGEITGLPLGKYGHFYDGEVGLKYEAPNNISVAAGYRAFDLNVKDPSNGEYAQYKMAGPFYNIEYKF